MDSNFDIVPTLRMFDGVMMGKAADEIEALRKEVATLRNGNAPDEPPKPAGQQDCAVYATIAADYHRDAPYRTPPSPVFVSGHGETGTTPDAPATAAHAEAIGYINAGWVVHGKGTTTVYNSPHPILATAPVYLAAPTAAVDDGVTFNQWFYGPHVSGWNGKACTASEESLAWQAWQAARASMPEWKAVTNAARGVLAERERQVTVEGWTPEHDDMHKPGELALNGSCYAFAASQKVFGAGNVFDTEPPTNWTWSAEWWKPGTPRRMLEKAAALILAEIERIDRATTASDSATPKETGEAK